jgi:N4-gp56 family major capsid protein
MADNFTTSTSGLGSNLVTLAYDKLIELNLRSVPQFRAIADKKIGSPTHDGSSIRFQFHNDIADTTIQGATLSETVDPDAVALPATTTLDVAQTELGRVVLPTRKLSLMSLADVDPWIANAVAFNMATTLDNGVAAVLDAGTNVIRESAGALSTTAAKSTIVASDTFKGRDVRYAVTKLRASNVVPRGGMYVSYIHPEVSHDLRTETGNNIWRTPHEYQNAGPLFAGELGAWEGVRFIETPRMTNSISGGALTALATAPAVSGASGAFTIVVANGAFGGLAEVGDNISGTGVGGSGTNAITDISVGATNTTLTVTVANSGTVGTNTLTVTPKARVYNTYVLGQQALAEAVWKEPGIEFGNVVDKLNRFRPVGWHGIINWSIYRQEALYRIETASSVRP